MTTLGMFIENLQTDPLFFLSVVATVIISITLHELAHGYAAVALGDDTPILLPIPPLDGSGVLEGFIPGFRQNVLSRVNPMVLLAVIFIGFGPFGKWLFDAAVNVAVWWLGIIR